MCIENSSAIWKCSLFLVDSVIICLFYCALHGLFHYFNHTSWGDETMTFLSPISYLGFTVMT